MSEDLLKQINPIYLTAKQTIKSFADRGDEDAEKIVDYIDRYKKHEEFGSQEKSDTPASRVFTSVPEYRYSVMNTILEMRTESCLLDMPCGYTSRGARYASAHRRYVGADLPAVIGDMRDAVYSFIDEDAKKLVTYAEVDATNAESIENALSGVSGSVCITTEGLLSYFTDSELAAMFNAVHKVLSKHGGCWITPDREIQSYMQTAFRVVANGDEQVTKEIRGIIAAIKKNADTNTGSNQFFSSDLNKSIEIAEKHGFKVERIPVSRYMPDLESLMPIREGIMDDLREACRDIAVWKLTAAAQNAAGADGSNMQFGVQLEAAGGHGKMKVSGRVDTLTAPEIITTFEGKEKEISSIEIDLAEVPYISSAGLRALLMIFKKMGSKENFRLTGCCDAVMEILDTAGFTEIMF